MISVQSRSVAARAMGAPLAGWADEELIGRFADRRDERAERAFAELVRRHGPMVLGLCRHLLRDSHDADDAFQATFLVLARKAGSIRSPELLAHWLQGVAVRVARRARILDGRRRRFEGRAVATLEVEPVGDPGRQDQRLARVEAAQAVHEELARLPEIYRSPVVLCDLGGLTHAEAAGRLRWPLGSVSVRLMRARDLLRSRLGRRGLAPSASLLAVALAAEAASASVPRGLARGTVRAALRFASGTVPAAGGVPGPVAAMAGSALKAMAIGQALTAAVALVVIGVATLAVGVAARGDVDVPSIAGRDLAPTSTTGPKPPDSGPSPTRPVAGLNPDNGEIPRGPASGAAANLDDLPRSAIEDASKAYPALARRAGRDADSQVRLALWCESHGLAPERLHHLSLAILRDPSHAGARALMGQVSFEGRWRRLEEVGRLVRLDEGLSDALEAYQARRSKTANTADAQWKLANWCEQQGLKAESTAHLRAVTRLNPAHELARRKLGFRRVNGRWLTAEQIDREQAEAAARKEGNRRWGPLLARWRGWLDEPARRLEAERALNAVVDPYAVPSIWAAFASGGPADPSRAVHLLGQVDSPSSTFALATLAVFSSSEPARRVASEILALRDPRDAVALLVGLLLDPEPNPDSVVFRYQCLPIGALGIGSPGITLVEGRRANILRTYTLDESLGSSVLFSSFAVTGSAGYNQRLATQRANQGSELEAIIGEFIAQAIREVGPVRSAALRFNGRVIQTLRNVTKLDRGGSWEDWKRWWVEGQGYAYDPEAFRNPPDLAFFEPKPTYESNFHVSCFGAGTPVRTLIGSRPIESIQVGDRVLTQDVEGGGLEFAPVLGVAHNPPAETLRVDLGEVPIVSTGIHRFWIAGKGWVMARDLRAGDVVRTLDGLAPVRSIAADRTQPVFNLEVGRGRTFFAGQPAALVHDNSRVEPVARAFDALHDPGTQDGR